MYHGTVGRISGTNISKGSVRFKIRIAGPQARVAISEEKVEEGWEGYKMSNWRHKCQAQGDNFGLEIIRLALLPLRGILLPAPTLNELGEYHFEYAGLMVFMGEVVARISPQSPRRICMGGPRHICNLTS